MFFRKKKVEERKFDPEFIKNYNEFCNYFQGRLDALNGKRRSVTISSTMADKLSVILKGIKL